MTIDALQDRSTPIQIEETTRLTGGDERFHIESRYASDATYDTWMALSTREGVEAFRDIVQYVLASLSDDTEMPSTYENTLPFNDRERAFTERHWDFTNTVEREERKVTATDGSAEFIAVLNVESNHESPAPIWFTSTGEIQSLLDACNAWVAYTDE